MLLTIYNLPENTRYLDVKSLIESKCGITDMILDNLMSWGSYMKVTVGLASEEDAAILVRKVNGLFVNGTQLHVEDVRKKKQASEQPYYNTRNVSYQNHQNEPAYMGQPSDQSRYQANKEPNVAPLLTFYQSTLGPYTPNAPLVQQNVYTPYGGQPAVQYPTPQRMYQAPNQPEQEPLGFRSEGNANPWSHSQRRDNEPKSSFSQRDIRWSPARGQRNERPPRSSRWGDGDSDRDGARRRSPPRDRRPHDRDDQPGTSRKLLRSQAWASNRENFRTSDDRGPQRSNDRFFKDNRNPQAPLSKREFERASFSHPKPAKKEQRRPDPNSHHPWAKPNPGSIETQHWKEQSHKPARKRSLEPNIEDRPKRVRLPTLKEFTKSTKGKPKLTTEEYKKFEAVRSETWRAQTASQIAKDMIEGKTISGVEHNAFFKELKRMLRERLVGLCHPLERHDGLYVKYRKKFKEEDDEKFIEEVVESVNLTKAVRIERSASKKSGSEKVEASGDVKHEKADVKPAQVPTDVKVPIDSKPLGDADGTFKIPLVPKLKTETPMVDDKEPKYTKKELFKFKLQKQQTKRIFNHESVLLKSLDPKHAEALEEESKILLEKFLEGCHDHDVEEKVLFERLTTTVAEDFKRVVKVNVARRMTNFDQPIVRVFCSPKMLGRAALSQFLEGQGITAIKKASKHPMMLAACQNYEVHDRLCTSEPFQIQDRIISFKPLQIAGPPVKVTRDRINEQRKKFIESQIDNTDDDDEMKLMNDIQEFQQNLEDETAENIESGANKTNTIKEEKQSPNNSIDNIPIEDFTDDVDVVFAQKDISVDDYKIVEDTIGNFNNNEGIEDFSLDGGNVGDGEEAAENIDTSDVQDGGNDTSDIQNGGNDTSDVQDGRNADHIDENGGDMGEDEGNMDDSEEQVQEANAVDDNDCEDVDIGDIDEDDLEDY